MHGFHQGLHVMGELIDKDTPDIFMLQEHWLTVAELYCFESHIVNYFSFGCCALSKNVECGMLCGRPLSGVITLVGNHLRQYTTTIHCEKRFVIVKVCNYLLINVLYLPRVGSPDCIAVCDDVLLFCHGAIVITIVNVLLLVISIPI